MNYLKIGKLLQPLIAVGVAVLFAGCRTGVSPNSAQIYSVLDYGAKGDGQTDDTVAINKTIQAASSNGGGIVVFPKASYSISRRVVGSQGPAVLLKPNVSLDGQGSTLVLNGNCSFIGIRPDMTAVAFVERDVLIGERDLYVNDTEKLREGDLVGIKLGDNAWDKAETQAMHLTKVIKVVDTHHLKVADKIPHAMQVGATVPKNRGVLRFRSEENALCENFFIQNFELKSGPRGNAEAGVDLRLVRNVRVQNIKAYDPGAGVVLLAYCRDVFVKDIWCVRSAAINGHSAKGRVLNVWNSDRCHFENIRGDHFQGAFVFFESYCRNQTGKNWVINDTWAQQEKTSKLGNSILHVVQDSHLSLDGLIINGSVEGAVLYTTGGTPGVFSLKNVAVRGEGKWKAFPVAAIDRNIELNGQKYTGQDMQSRIVKFAPGKTTTLLPVTVPDNSLWRRVSVELRSKILSRDLVVFVRNAKATIHAGQRTAVVPHLGAMGTDYPSNPATESEYSIKVPDIHEKITLRVVVEYFPPAHSND